MSNPKTAIRYASPARNIIHIWYGFTLCSGIICEELNGTDYLAVPYREDKDNQNAKMEIGYIQPKNTELDEIGQTFLREMQSYLSGDRGGAAPE